VKVHLGVCHRCPTTHLRLANEVVRQAADVALYRAFAAIGVLDVEVRSGAEEGVVVYGCTFISHPLGGSSQLVTGSRGGAPSPHIRQPPPPE